MDASNISGYMCENKERLLHDYLLTRIALFGSIARGEQNDLSDIDLVIKLESGTPDLYTLKTKSL